MSASRRNARRAAPSLRSRLAPLLDGLSSLAHHALALLALLLVAAALYLAQQALQRMPVERIVVSGKLEHLRQDALRQALMAKLDSGLLFLDLRALQAEVEALPWVYRAQLRRRFPDTLEVRVREQVPIARWSDAGFLNHEARIIEVSDAQRWQDLPRIRGPEGSAGRLINQYQRLLEQLRPTDLTPREISEDALGQLRVTLSNGVLLELGDRDRERRVQRFVTLWSRELAALEQAVRRVDMRYESGAAVALAEPEAPQQLIANTQ